MLVILKLIIVFISADEAHWLLIIMDAYLERGIERNVIAPGTTPRAKGGDLTYVKSIASPLERMLWSNAPIRTVYFHPIIWSNPPNLGHVYWSNEIKSPPFASREVGGAIHW